MAEDGVTAAALLDPFGEGTEMLVILLQSLRVQLSSLYMGLHGGILRSLGQKMLLRTSIVSRP
jgi:hypothetical protein